MTKFLCMLVLLITVLTAFVSSRGAQVKTGASHGGAAAARQETPFACNRAALTPEERKRHFDVLGPALRSLKKGVHELPDGYEFEFPSDSKTFQLAAEWANGERACCPFFDIQLRLQREGGPLFLRLTGRNGVKDFIKVDGASWLKQ